MQPCVAVSNLPADSECMSSFLSTRLVAALLVLQVFACSQEKVEATSRSGAGQDPVAAEGEPSKFARFVKTGQNEGRFDVAVTTYRGPGGEEVSLVSAVHLADKRHYDELQELFESYDVLLYELVADSETRPKPGQARKGGGSMVGMFQVMLKNALGLEFQLHAIDYTPDNFVHADLTPKAFAEKMEERGESFATIFLRLMSQEMKRQKELAEEADDEKEQGKSGGAQAFDLVSAFRNREGRHTMRMMFAQQLEHIEVLAAGGGEEGSVLLEGRNDRAVEVLREQIGKGHKKLAIYFGAAHMPGIENSLIEELGFKKAGHKWLMAWDITKRLDPVRKKKER